MEKNNNMFINVLLPIVLFIASFLISLLIGNMELTDSIIISMLIGITSSLISLAHNLEQTRKLYDDINENIRDIEVFLDIKSQTENIDHPYFKKWSKEKFRLLLEKNRDFFEGTNRTHPHSLDTFGIEGLSYTKKHGLIQAVSVVPDYWEDNFCKDYLDRQEKLIKENDVTIQRIFIISKEHEDKYFSLIKEQSRIGIQTGFIYDDDEFIPPRWLKEDYLIQDGILLVQIFCDSHRYNYSNDSQTELITLDKRQVKEKIEQFNRMWERAEKFQDNEKN